MEVGPDGQPIVNTFGNADQFNGSTAGSRPQNVSESQDPAVDVLESKKDNSIKIIVEMPGVTKENIKVTENQGMVNITAENGDRKYNKNIPTGKKLDADKSKANYLNGILELKIPLRKSEEEKNIRID
jgi:HSP20 family protein